MLWSHVTLAAGAALLGAQDAQAFFIWWPFDRPIFSPHAFTGCVKRTSTWTSIFSSSAPTAERCVANCNGRGAAMAYWVNGRGTCKCGSTPNPLGLGLFDWFTQDPYVSGNAGECGSNYESYMMTPYGFLGCASDVDVGNAVGRNKASVLSSSFRRCNPENQVMLLKYADPRKGYWTSYCFNPDAPPIVAEYDPIQCRSDTYFLYGRDPSQEKKRATRARRGNDAELYANPWCPKGLTACQVDQDENLGYECVDVEADDTQCGGCAIAEYGLNAGNRTGSDCGGKASCIAGQCIPFSH